MEVPDRQDKENELAAALLLLWMLLKDSGWSVIYGSIPGRLLFQKLFGEHVRPIFVRIYGAARSALGGAFGVQYSTTPDGTMRLPGLDDAVRRYEHEVYDSFARRMRKREDWESHRENWDRQGIPEEERPKTITDREGRQVTERDIDYDEEDAGSAGVSWTTDAHSHGEIDGSSDLGQRGIYLDAIWMTEPGACQYCEPMDGLSRDEWSRVHPDGPKVHPNCRCWLKWVEVK